MASRKKGDEGEDGFNLEKGFGRMTLTELIMIVFGFLAALAVLVKAMSRLAGMA